MLKKILNEPDTKLLMRLEELMSAETCLHSSRVAKITEMMLPKLEIQEDPMSIIKGALLHDIGKIYVPLNLITYPLPLSDEQRRVIGAHSLVGSIILSDYDEVIRNIALLHHEHEKPIPDYIELVQAVDVYDALSTNRVYRKKYDRDEIERYLIQETKNSRFAHEVLKLTDSVEIL